MESSFQHNLNRDLQKLGTRYAGAYLLNKFFIRIVTNTHKKQIKSYDYDDHSFSDEDQIELQKTNYPTLYHEYLHYIHEVSTMAGITQFYLSVVNRAIFSQFVNLPQTSLPMPITGDEKVKFDKINMTLIAATGGSLQEFDNRAIFKIDEINCFDFPAYEPSRDIIAPIKVPMVIYSYRDATTYKDEQDSVFFGKYFLYEGLAHHLDQIVTIQLGRETTPKHLVRPEYKLMEMVAKYYFKTLDERSMLEMASISLCYFNCGQRFISMVKEASTVEYLPGYIMELHNEASLHLAQHQEEINLILEEIKKIFEKRSGMHAAASHLCNVMAAGYAQRIKRPVFEIDITYSGNLQEMRHYVDLCDMVYELADEDEYLRDYAGTYLSNDLANDLRTFLCHVDYFQTSVANVVKHKCPLFTFCPHQLRKEKPNQCSTNPRLSYEDQSSYGWCHYSWGVAYMTGLDVA